MPEVFSMYSFGVSFLYDLGKYFRDFQDRLSMKSQ